MVSGSRPPCFRCQCRCIARSNERPRYMRSDSRNQSRDGGHVQSCSPSFNASFRNPPVHDSKHPLHMGPLLQAVHPSLTQPPQSCSLLRRRQELEGVDQVGHVLVGLVGAQRGVEAGVGRQRQRLELLAWPQWSVRDKGDGTGSWGGKQGSAGALTLLTRAASA